MIKGFKKVLGLRKQKLSPKLKRLRFGSVIQVYVKATFNNTIITITDTAGEALIWGSAGSCGFRGKKKKTPFASRKVLNGLLCQMRICRIRRAELIVRGVGAGRRGIGRVLRQFNIRILVFKDQTPIPHNGCRLRKKRRRRNRPYRISFFRKRIQLKLFPLRPRKRIFEKDKHVKGKVRR